MTSETPPRQPPDPEKLALLKRAREAAENKRIERKLAEARTKAIALQDPLVPLRAVADEREAFQRTYLALLTEPGVLGNIRKHLTIGDAKMVKDVLQALLPVLVPAKEAASGPTQINFVSAIPRQAPKPAVVVDAAVVP